MTFEWFIGLRYLRAKHRHGFISLISLISVAGITVGVIALITVLAVFSGFTEGLRDQILGVNSHIIVQRLGGSMQNYDLTREQVLTVSEVTGSTPYLFAQTLLSSASGGNGVVLRGIDPQTAKNVINLPSQMIDGTVDDLLGEQAGPGIPNIILGKNLAQDLRVRVNDRVKLISPSGPLTPMGSYPRSRPVESQASLKPECSSMIRPLPIWPLPMSRVFSVWTMSSTGSRWR